MTIRAHFRRQAPAAILALSALFAASAGAYAQGLENPEAVDRIVGSDVQEEEANATAQPERVLAAIDKTSQNIEAVRKASALDSVDIVFLPDAAAAEGGPPEPIRERIEQRREQIEALRDEIEGNAMLYHAINARRILPRDVLAVDFRGEREIVIYAAAKKPAG